MPLELTIRRDGSLGSVTRQTITEAQATIVLAIVGVDDLTYGEVLKFLADRRALIEASKSDDLDPDDPTHPRFFGGPDVGFSDDDHTGAGDDVEAYRG